MALVFDPAFKGHKVKKQYNGLIEVCEEKKELLLNLGPTIFFKQSKATKKDASNKEGD